MKNKSKRYNRLTFMAHIQMCRLKSFLEKHQTWRNIVIGVEYCRLWLRLLRPFSPQTIHEEAEVIRLAWWFRRAFGVTRRDSMYEDAAISSRYGVRVVRQLFHIRYNLDHPLHSFYPDELDGIYDIEFGSFGGRESSLHILRRAKLPQWQRTSYDDPPGEVIRRHGEAVSGLIACARAKKLATFWQLLFALITHPLLHRKRLT